MIHRVTTSDNKWYNKWQRMTTSENEWPRAVQPVTTSDNKWQRVTTNDNESQRMTTVDNEWERVIKNDKEWQRMAMRDYQNVAFFSNCDFASGICSNFFRTVLFSEKLLLHTSLTTSTQQLLFRSIYFFRAAAFFKELRFRKSHFVAAVIF